MSGALYPESPAARTRWIRDRRLDRTEVDPTRAYAAFVEQERGADGTVQPVGTIFLTNRECPWTCAMCDLWRNTTAAAAPPGAIPAQIERALSGMPPARVLKLYNSGSFFDAGAIPRADWPEIARLCRRFEHVIVESHPRLIGSAVLEWAALLEGSLEVAMGLETANPEALQQLNKRFTLANYIASVSFLNRAGIAIRAFLMVRPPFVAPEEQNRWLQDSLRFAFDHGASVVSLIPTRLGNGALESLGVEEPALTELEEGQEFGLSMRAGRVFADVWDLERFSRCPECAAARKDRISRMNLAQRFEPRINCPRCEGR